MGTDGMQFDIQRWEQMVGDTIYCDGIDGRRYKTWVRMAGE